MVDDQNVNERDEGGEAAMVGCVGFVRACPTNGQLAQVGCTRRTHAPCAGSADSAQGEYRNNHLQTSLGQRFSANPDLATKPGNSTEPLDVRALAVERQVLGGDPQLHGFSALRRHPR